MGVKGDEFPLQGQGTESLVGYGATPHVMTIIIKNALGYVEFFLTKFRRQNSRQSALAEFTNTP